MNYTVLIFLFGFLLLLPATALAQPERYEVGQHLVLFDKAWEQHRQDAAAKKRALKHLLPVVPTFFAGQFTQAAQLLDKARFALASKDEVPIAVQWAESLYLRLDKRLLEPGEYLGVTLDRFYKGDAKIPDNAELELWVSRENNFVRVVKAQIKKLPLTLDVPIKGLPVGDHFLQIKITVAGKEVSTREQMISVVEKPKPRLLVLKKGLTALPGKAKNTDRETVSYLISLLDSLTNGATHETNYPAARLFAETEAALAAIQAGKNFYGNERTGQYWLKLPTAKGTFISRLFAPKQAKQGKPLPLVVALHGAGASENLFFESYGDGLIVKMCDQRGWLLVSPGTNSFLAFTMPVAAIVEEVAKLYPVDKNNIFVIGHSMGASQAVAAAQESPHLFAGVAALGGTGPVTAPAKIKAVPFLVGVGDQDFALPGARNLAKQLQDGGVAKLELKEYADIEHIMVVREALPDVFALFEKAAKKG